MTPLNGPNENFKSSLVCVCTLQESAGGDEGSAPLRADFTFHISFRLSNRLYYLFYAHIFWQSTTCCLRRADRRAPRTGRSPSALGDGEYKPTHKGDEEGSRRISFGFCRIRWPSVLAGPRREEKESNPQPWRCQANICVHVLLPEEHFQRKLFP